MTRLAFALTAALAALAPALSACSGCDDGGGEAPDAGPPDAGPKPFTECSGTDQSFVRQASLALLGRRPLSQAEVDVYAGLMAGVRAKDQAAGQPVTEDHARRVAARALMQDPAFAARWERFFLDRLRVQRIDDQEMQSCWGGYERVADDGALARAVRDAAADADVSGGASFTMRDLLRSAIVADDLSPVYRGQLFVLVSRPIPAANVDALTAELARREDFGTSFDATYLNRDLVCLGCHNSEASTTFNEDPAQNRHWPVPGLFEKSIYGDSTGTDPRRAHAMFRFDGFVGGNDKPWGWSDACGAFNRTVSSDPADVDAKFASVSGKAVTVYDTEAALARGFAKLREDGLVLAADKTIADPDVAFAYVVSMNIVDGLWTEVTGSSLVIANYFPRNEASRDLLQLLTERFVASDFSLQAVLEEILATPYFDRLPPASGCGTGPYNMPAVYDPWVTSDSDPERRQNGPGDGVSPLSTRTAAHAAYTALGWPTSPLMDFPVEPGGFCDSDCGQLKQACGFGFCCTEYNAYCVQMLPRPDAQYAADERAFQRATGMYLKNAERGFRGLDFQARLEWENRFGLCRAPSGLQTGQPDFVAQLVQRAGTTAGATLRDVVLALKDRVVSEPFIVDAGEQSAIEAVLGSPLDTPAAGLVGLEGKVRHLCGALVSSPQFLLGGLAPLDRAPVPLLTPDDASFAARCAAIAGRPLPEGLQVTCNADGTLTVQ